MKVAKEGYQTRSVVETFLFGGMVSLSHKGRPVVAGMQTAEETCTVGGMMMMIMTIRVASIGGTQELLNLGAYHQVP